MTRWEYSEYAFASLLIVAFAGLCYVWAGFTIDDAFITLRYSQHLANGFGPVWNIGADPVEGYTSTLWMLIGAIPHLFSIDAILFMKAVGIFAGAISILGVFTLSLYENVKTEVAGPISASLALSPAFAVISVQGMETTTAGVLVLLGSYLSYRLVKKYRRWTVVGIYISLLLAVLTRPAIATFGAGLLIGVYVILWRNNSSKRAVRFGLLSVPFLFLPGFVTVGIRWGYFGYPLPNPFYIKQSASIISFWGATYVARFVTAIIGVPIILASFASYYRDDKLFMNEINRLSPIFLGAFLFLSVWVFIRPVQGYLWRYQMPVLPALLFSAAVLINQWPVELADINLSIDKSTVTTIILVAILLVYPLHTGFVAHERVSNKQVDDRVAAGKALSSLSGEDYRMFVTEAGALPYYSQWYTVDYIGLNSEYIAHHGLSSEYLEEYNPDLIQIPASVSPGYLINSYPIVANFLDSSDYRLVAVSRKTGRNSNFHLYFVDRSSDGYTNITCTLQDMDAELVQKQTFVTAAKVDIQTANSQNINC